MIKSKLSKTISAGLTIPMLSVLMLTACGSNETGGANNAPSSSPAGQSASPAGSNLDNVYPENGLPKDQKVTLKFGFFEGGMGREYIDYAIDSFKKKFPNVSFEVVYSPKIGDVINAKISAGDDADMFDLFNGSIPGGIEPLVAAGKLEAQDDLWDRKLYDLSGKTLKEMALSGTSEAAVARVNGKLYALPIAGSGNGLFFNKTLFEKHGWNQNPKTWSEFVQLLEDIKSKGIIPITYPGKYPGYIEFAFGPVKMFELAALNGSKYQDDYANFKLPQYTAPESLEVWNRIYELGKKGYFPEGVAALTHTQSQMQMIQGQAAMVSTGVYVENEMKDSIPKDFVWGFMSTPMSDKPDSTLFIRSTAASGHYIWASKPELNKKWAKEFNVWMWNLDVQGLVAEKGGQLPVRTDFSDDAARAAKLQNAPKAMFEYMKANKSKMVSSNRNLILSDPSFQQATKLIADSTTEISSGKKDPKPVLEEAEKLLQKALDAQKK